MAGKTKEANGEGSIFPLPDGRYRVQVTIPGTRPRRFKTRRAATLVEARKIRRQLIREVARTGDQGDMTTGEWLRHWVDEVKPYDGKARQTTVDEYRGIIESKLIPQLGHVPLDKLNAFHIRELHKAMRTWKVRSKDGKRVIRVGLSPTTISHTHAVLRSALRQALAERRIEYNPAEVVSAPAPSGNHHEQPRREHLQSILASDLTVRERARVWVALHGLRPAEALGLLWSDVHLSADSGEIRVEASLRRVKGVGLIRTPPKSPASRRTVPLSPAAAHAMAMLHQETGGKGYVFAGRPDRYSPPDPSRATDPSRDHKNWEAILQRAGVPDVPLYGARGAFASLLDAAHVSNREVADLAGHAQVATTQDNYLRSTAAQRTAAVAVLEQALLGP